MSDKKVNVSLPDFSELAFVLFVIAFWGEPDIVDALIQYILFLAGG